MAGEDEDDPQLQAALAISLMDSSAPQQQQDGDDEQLSQALALSLQQQPGTTTDDMPGLIPFSFDDDDEKKALELSMQPQEAMKSTFAVSQETSLLLPSLPDLTLSPPPTSSVYDATKLVTAHALLWDTSVVTRNDQERWVQQGMTLSGGKNHQDLEMPDDDDNNNESARLEALRASPTWALVQQHGGPCGVLAAVQAEILRHLMWCSSIGSRRPKNVVGYALSIAMGRILARAAGSEKEAVVQLVLPTTLTNQDLLWEDFGPWMKANSESSTKLSVYTLSDNPNNNSELSSLDPTERLAQRTAAFLRQAQSNDTTPLEQLAHAGGVLLFVLSVLETHGLSTICSETDHPTTLTAQFGQGGQELMNLLLTGHAVSNVFDGVLRPSGGELTCRGIPSRPVVGYLSHLEALRYCHVGSYYKTPRYPVWVVGSQSHFTVLWGSQTALSESTSDVILETCRRAFQSVAATEDGGFIATEQLGSVLEALEWKKCKDEAAVSVLRATLEVPGAGIILWDDFWKATSRLLTGASLESVISSSSDEVATYSANNNINSALETAASTPVTSATATSTLEPPMETDEEMARRLASEWESIDVQADTDSDRAVSGSPVNVEKDLYTTTIATTAGNNSRAVPMDLVDGDDTKDSKPATKSTTSSIDFESYGTTFPLYHYNGLRGGVLTEFRVTRLSPEEAVGVSIALSQSGGGVGGNGGDLEDVVRTKWPSCAVNWMGKASPYID